MTGYTQPDTIVITVDPAESTVTPPNRRIRARAWLSRHRRLQLAYRIAIAVVGSIVTVIGVLLVPLPGPGWLIVFAGLWILGAEFAAARAVTRVLKRMLRAIGARIARWRAARRERRSNP
ncbi:MAG: hypothetical protein JWN36_1301 [Microbacteriaceae bacterium]|nr:hypothetical protein [Microbacteriaceae bacterium]